jgi:hypothetical protein
MIETTLILFSRRAHFRDGPRFDLRRTGALVFMSPMKFRPPPGHDDRHTG